jgi:hypothetical protein
MPATRRRLDDACAAVVEVAAVYAASIRPLCVGRQEADEGGAEGEGSGRKPYEEEEEEEDALRQAAARIEQLLAEAKTIITATTVVQKFVTAPPPPAS